MTTPSKEDFERQVKVLTTLNSEIIEMLETIQGVRGESYCRALTTIFNLQTTMSVTMGMLPDVEQNTALSEMMGSMLAKMVKHAMDSFAIISYPVPKDASPLISYAATAKRDKFIQEIIKDMDVLMAKQAQYIPKNGEF